MGRFTWLAYLQATVILTVGATLYWFGWRVFSETGYNVSALVPMALGTIGLYLLSTTWMEG